MASTQQAFDEAVRCQQAGHSVEAKGAFLRVLDASPSDASVIAQVGQSLMELGFTAEAEKAFISAADRFPKDWSTHNNLGTYYAMQEDFAKAEISYRRVVALNPRDATALYTLGVILHKLGRAPEALVQFRFALGMGSEEPGFYRNVGEALFSLFCIEDAIAPLTRCLEENSGDIAVRMILGCGLNMVGRYGEHIALMEALAQNPQPLDNSQSNLVLDLFVNPEITVADERRLLSDIFSYLGDRAAPLGNETRPAEKKLSIGYLSSFLNNTNYMGFVEKVVACHDKDKFSVKIFSDAHIMQTAENVLPPWVPIDSLGQLYATGNLSNADLCENIRRDELDILIDLNGFAAINRMELLAMKPAPVVVSWFNAFSTLGLDSVDYLIGDDIVTPADEDSRYRESICRLPGSYLIRELEHDAPPVQAAPIVENGYCTFGSLAAANKTHTGCIEAWARVLKEVPDSRLVLRNSNSDENLSRFLYGEFDKYDIDNARVDIFPPANHAEFLETYDRIDIALDSFPWNGGTTTVEALWQGVPMVCFRGDRWVSRVGATIVTAVGYSEWIGENLDEYVQIAVELSKDPQKLQRIREGLREAMAASPLCDVAGFTKKLEAAYDDMARSKGIVA